MVMWGFSFHCLVWKSLELFGMRMWWLCLFSQLTKYRCKFPQRMSGAQLEQRQHEKWVSFYGPARPLAVGALESQGVRSILMDLQCLLLASSEGQKLNLGNIQYLDWCRNAHCGLSGVCVSCLIVYLCRGAQPLGISGPPWKKKKSCLGLHIKYTATRHHTQKILIMFYINLWFCVGPNSQPA